MAANPHDSLGLLDVLEQLPRDVLRADLWLQLADASPESTAEPGAQIGRAFRLTCQRSLRLSDQLTRRLKLLVDTESNVYDEGRVVLSNGAFLARQDGLEELTLTDNSDSNGDSLVIKTLLLGGDSVCQQLQVLRIDTGAACTTAAARCVQMCCPNIREVALSGVSVHSTFFLHLRLNTVLTKVTLCTSCYDVDVGGCGEVLRSLAALPSLRTLEVEGLLLPAHVPLLAQLTGLETLNARRLLIDPAPEDGIGLGQALACLTRLTRLLTPDCGTAPQSGEVVNAAAAHLTPLRRLAALSLRCSSVVPVLDAGFDAICQVSSLTRLACPTARCHGHIVVRGGSLPLLQHLRIREGAKGHELAAMLRPLRPLPQLRHLSCMLLLEDDLTEADHEDIDGQATAGAWQAAAILAAAPHLHQISLVIAASDNECVSLTGPATALLTPLRDRLADVRLLEVPAAALDTLLPTLCLASRLETVSLRHCRLSDTWLPLAAQHLQALRRLQLEECTGVDADSALEVAALRVQPLHVVWLPQLTAVEQQQFLAMARAGVTVGCDYVRWDGGDF